jgi:hypothetical protein
MPEPVEDCVQSVLEDNPDYSESRAYAICNAKQNQGELGLSDDASHDDLLAAAAEQDGECPQGKVKAGDSCVPVEEVSGVPPSALDMSAHRILASRALAGPIERQELPDGRVRYENVALIDEGVWRDAGSGQPTHYDPAELEIVEDNTLNIAHDAENEVSAVGRIDASSWEVEDGTGYADIVLDMDSPASEYADENLQAALESEGEKGFGGPSIEIPADAYELEREHGESGVPKLVDGEIHGAGLVMEPASKSTAFSHQVAERGVAMSADTTQDSIGVYLQAGSMSETTREEIQAEVLSRELEVEEIQDDAQAIADELDIPVGDVMEVLDPLLDMDEDEDEGGEDVENEEDDGEEAEDDEEDDEEDTEMAAEEEIEELWNAIEDLKEEMASGAEMEEAREELSAAREELASEEEVRELREAKEELAGRLEELEGEPEKPKSLADDSGFEAEFDPSVGSPSDW